MKHEDGFPHPDARRYTNFETEERQTMRSGVRKAKKTLADQLAGGVNALRDLASDLADAVESLSEGRPPRIEELTLADVIGFFVDNKEKTREAVAGAILRDREAIPHGDRDPAEGAYLVHLLFLDRDGRPLITARDPRRSYLAKRFDAELAAAFGTNNIVIFN
jgi:hypothetical protein